MKTNLNRVETVNLLKWIMYNVQVGKTLVQEKGINSVQNCLEKSDIKLWPKSIETTEER